MHSYWQSLVGGLLIGLASWLLLASMGRIAGISGIASGAFAGGHPDLHGCRVCYLFDS